MSESMQFQVNLKLLGGLLKNIVLSIQYASPLGFSPSHQDFAIRQGAMQYAGEKVEVRAVFQYENAQAYMILSAISQNRWNQLVSPTSHQELNSGVWTIKQSTAYHYKDFKV